MENFLQQLKALSSAEDFLQFFGVPFDQGVVNVSWLHILKRFFQYIRQDGAGAGRRAADVHHLSRIGRRPMATS